MSTLNANQQAALNRLRRSHQPPLPHGRKQRCRLLTTTRSGSLDRCNDEVAEPGAEIDLCTRHLADAFTLLKRRNLIGANR